MLLAFLFWRIAGSGSIKTKSWIQIHIQYIHPQPWTSSCVQIIYRKSDVSIVNKADIILEIHSSTIRNTIISTYWNILCVQTKAVNNVYIHIYEGDGKEGRCYQLVCKDFLNYHRLRFSWITWKKKLVIFNIKTVLTVDVKNLPVRRYGDFTLHSIRNRILTNFSF